MADTIVGRWEKRRAIRCCPAPCSAKRQYGRVDQPPEPVQDSTDLGLSRLTALLSSAPFHVQLLVCYWSLQWRTDEENVYI